mmetsp:Transcript_46597/g.77024  ORF Transcript_46597/g.77024 Transcript_46597/m.77024 type:complete len:283 (+) Transcript_46597:20-868(+)|eukprot:CAMPEP_0119311600 /NCGR_PEP_ID=MMETSP1333-20130426/23091_1 /TAXON_ID=418940 /ORGANISM="Scyphosphaera apsteinii, Strain RCC1455" /LENGTH=282 /DNA_ID=CAMNT_0007316025 /DNA_START=20 /DNA_END=868 /DNA_ORIENTATION=-
MYGGLGFHGAYEEEDEEESDDECNDGARCREVMDALPPNMSIRAVGGSHRKECSDCGYNDWGPGDYYVYDAQQPWGTDKLCLDCAHLKYCLQGDSEDEDDESEDDEDLEAEAAAEYAHSIESEMKEKGYQMLSGVDLQSRECLICHSVAHPFYFCSALNKLKDQYCSRCAEGHAPTLKPKFRAAASRDAAAAATMTSTRSPIKKAEGKKDAHRSTAGWQKWPKPRRGDWGLVYIIPTGKFGYYDDEEDGCIVYPNRPLQGSCCIYKRSQLRKPPFEGELVSM